MCSNISHGKLEAEVQALKHEESNESAGSAGLACPVLLYYAKRRLKRATS
jgi:hypothetical protein